MRCLGLFPSSETLKTLAPLLVRFPASCLRGFARGNPTWGPFAVWWSVFACLFWGCVLSVSFTPATTTTAGGASSPSRCLLVIALMDASETYVPSVTFEKGYYLLCPVRVAREKPTRLGLRCCDSHLLTRLHVLELHPRIHQNVSRWIRPFRKLDGPGT